MDNTTSHLNLPSRIHNDHESIIVETYYGKDKFVLDPFLRNIPPFHQRKRKRIGLGLTDKEIDINTEQAYIDALQPHFPIKIDSFRWVDTSDALGKPALGFKY
jgi:hypothetical protein